MDEAVRKALCEAVSKEPFAKQMGIRLADLEDGFARVEMAYTPETMNNMYARAHGGAIFALIDEAFEAAGQTDGTVVVGLNVNVTYVSSPKPGVGLIAEAKRFSQSKKTASYDIRVFDHDDNLIAACQAVAFRTGKPIPFL